MDVIGPERYAAALQAFRECLPQRQGDTGGIWRRLQWGAALDLFVLDCRSERAGGQYISTEQMEWLKAGLLNSTARFKIVCNSVPITDMSAMIGAAQAEDRWQGYPEQREEILGHIEHQGIEGVLWITGDVHFGQIGWVSPEGQVGHSAWEVYCGPSGGFLNPVAYYYVGNAPQYEQIIYDYNWVRFECDPVQGTVRVQHLNDDGESLSDQVLEV